MQSQVRYKGQNGTLQGRSAGRFIGLGAIPSFSTEESPCHRQLRRGTPNGVFSQSISKSVLLSFNY